MKIPKHVRLVDVGPRDGLQNEQAVVPTDVKVALIDLLSDAGFPAVEATAFVSPKWVPQMADASDVMARIRRKPGVRYPVLTPNMKGFEAALAAKADEVAVFVAASETFSRKNINCSIAESLERAKPVFEAARANEIRVRGYISCVLGCPYEGNVDPRKVGEVADALHRLGAYEVSLGDTIGTGTAGKTQQLGLAPGRRQRAMRGLTHHRRIIAVGDNQAGCARKIALLIENARQMRRHGPVETVAIVEIIRPLAVPKEVRLRDLDLDDRESALAVDRHQVGAATVGQRHFANREQVLAAEQARHSARHVGGDRRRIGETGRLGQRGHAGRLEQSANAANPGGGTRPKRKRASRSSSAVAPLSNN